jgi:hypothetical protein
MMRTDTFAAYRFVITIGACVDVACAGVGSNEKTIINTSRNCRRITSLFVINLSLVVCIRLTAEYRKHNNANDHGTEDSHCHIDIPHVLLMPIFYMDYVKIQ